MLASYFAIGMLLILRGFDWLIQRVIARALRTNRIVEKPSIGLHLRMLLGGFVRLVVLFGLGLPYVMATVMTYRPKVDLRDDPQTQLGFQFEPVQFTATDGTTLSGWWMPAQHPRGRGYRAVGQDTVLICHGLASNKSNQLILSRGFVPYGYNVLIFDFRAHGESGGQLTSFGDVERRDVLGAVRWIREHHITQAHHIYGVGASMGAAALIAAAADPSTEGKAIDAIAAYGTYDSMHAEMEYIASERFIAPLRWIIERFGLPMASARSVRICQSFRREYWFAISGHGRSWSFMASMIRSFPSIAGRHFLKAPNNPRRGFGSIVQGIMRSSTMRASRSG